MKLAQREDYDDWRQEQLIAEFLKTIPQESFEYQYTTKFGKVKVGDQVAKGSFSLDEKPFDDSKRTYLDRVAGGDLRDELFTEVEPSAIDYINAHVYCLLGEELGAWAVRTLKSWVTKNDWHSLTSATDLDLETL